MLLLPQKKVEQRIRILPEGTPSLQATEIST
jgi:hypothetical protein